MTLATALFGCGNVGVGYGADPVMARYYPYASHNQVLADHPGFDWVAAIDTNAEAAAAVASQHGLQAHGTGTEFPGAETIEVAILATPPGSRKAIIDATSGPARSDCRKAARCHAGRGAVLSGHLPEPGRCRAGEFSAPRRPKPSRPRRGWPRKTPWEMCRAPSLSMATAFPTTRPIWLI